MPNARQDRADEPYCQTYPGLVQQIKARAETAAGENAYLLRTTVQHRGLGVVAIIAPRYAANQDAIRNTNVLLAGATPVDLPVHVTTKATHLRQYSFALPDGSHLVALWTDWLPVENDPGVAATVTIDGLGGSRAEAVDVLSGSSQELITSASNGRLVIKDLLAKDYPIFLRIGGPAG